MPVRCNVPCAEYCYAQGSSELFEYQYLGLPNNNLFHVAAYVRELEKAEPLTPPPAQQFHLPYLVLMVQVEKSGKHKD
jgi:hypothetical protein